MFCLSFIKRLYRFIYEDLTVFGKIVCAPFGVVAFPALFALSVVEIVLLDIIYVVFSRIDGEPVKKTIRYLWNW